MERLIAFTQYTRVPASRDHDIVQLAPNKWRNKNKVAIVLVLVARVLMHECSSCGNIMKAGMIIWAKRPASLCACPSLYRVELSETQRAIYY